MVRKFLKEDKIMNIWKCKRCKVIFTDENKVCGCKEGPSPWELIGKSIDKPDNIYKITIDDGFCACEFDIPSNGDKSINDIAKLVYNYLKCDSPLTGRYKRIFGESC